MKIFFGKDNSCGLNYQHNYIYYYLSKFFEITENIKEADVIVIAQTCACTKFNIINTLNYIDYVIKNKNNGAKIYLTGCITRKFHNDPDLLKVEKWLNKNIDFIIPQNQPDLLLKLISENKFGNRDSNNFGSVEIYHNDAANIYIANGCLNNCSFCKTTFQKYPLKSMDLNYLKENIDFLNEKKVSQIFLKATNVCQYGLDIYDDYMLPEIINYLEEKENIKNVSLVGFSFKDAIRNDFKKVLQNSTKVNELCGSLESGSDRLLEMMRKGFSSEEIIEFVKYVRQNNDKNLFLNIIAGFPTENIIDVNKTLEVLKELRPCQVDVCRYTNSPFVDSNKFNQLNFVEINEHARIYSKVLKKRNIKVNVNGQGYKYN